ncbi:uncharacterized protein KGF55_003635 [Candida pseudojiufengensis]|uniref:uncharacterized protein n=1 Tax=Candida pseudojiufengensis TaxID=497109 RepID=UPI00222415CD|nr:uncharacterized protein KGF55_003635 [Candida pseudojiufengensis]KAI5962559.1 hypothetical protein KGF55_003635 [Candida pseudojiufengensis]
MTISTLPKKSEENENSPLNPKQNRQYNSQNDNLSNSQPILQKSDQNHLRHAQYSSSSLNSDEQIYPSSNQFQNQLSLNNGKLNSSPLRRPKSGNAIDKLSNNNLESSHYTEFEEFSSPKRRVSFSANEYLKLNPEKPLFQRLLSSHHSVTNPNSPSATTLDFGYSANPNFNKSSSNLSLHHPHQPSLFLNSNNSGLNLDLEQQRRLSIVDIVNNLRPSKLIGNVKPLCNWYAYYKDNVNKIRNKQVRKYYEEQNYLIEKFQEIDNFLDAGKIHYNMLSNYNDSKKSNKETNSKAIALDHIEEMDEPLSGATTPISNNERQHLPNISNFDNLIKKSESERTDNSNGTSNDTSNGNASSKYSRFYDVPGNVANDGSKFLGYNEEEDNSQILNAILVNFFINVVLLIGKTVVSILTNSLSVIASLLDSILDFLSTFIIYIVNRLASQSNWKVKHSYPIGRSRLEPLGVLIFSIIIIISFFQVGQESFRRLFFSTPEQRKPATIGPDAIAIMTITIVAKFGCWVWCSKSKSSSVQALAQDAMTDVVFNTVSLLMPWLGHILNIWWFDSLGALLLSVYIILNWGGTAFEHINNLTGAVANQLDYKIILYLAMRFAEPIKQITALKVYHVGDNLQVEVDLVFATTDSKFKDLSFKDCHDIAEALQYSIESLPNVERAFVHIDYMEGNYKGHLK